MIYKILHAPKRLAALSHSSWHGLFRPKDEKETRKLEARVRTAFDENGLGSEESRAELIAGIAQEVAEAFSVVDEEDGRLGPIFQLAQRLMDYDGLFHVPEFDWEQRHTTAEYWAMRDELNRQLALVQKLDENRHLVKQLAGLMIEQVHQACPALYARVGDGDGIVVNTGLLDAVGELPSVVETILALPFADELVENNLFERLRDQLERNLISASGGNPLDPATFNKQPKMPADFPAQSAQHLVQSYLGATPLADFFDQSIRFTIPTQSRFEHHHIVAGSGHGKTQTLQYLIAHDLEAVAQGNRSVIVMDSQGDLIRNISNLAVFAPGGPLHERIVIIDPSDVEYPVSLNLFDVGQERLDQYSSVDRERLTNSILELYDFVLGTLLDAQMTQKQNVIFRFVTRLMLHIPDATIHTLRELMEPDAEVKFAEHIAKLSGTSRHFFETEFSSREFEQTKRQVLRRLWGILENQTFERMFSHPRSKLDMYREMNAGKVILINTAKDLLKESGTEIFGRFFIAMIAQAAQERSTIPHAQRMPTMVYVDEAQDYFDRNIEVILAQARKYNVGMVLAHQYLGQLAPGLQEAIAANTSIKFAGGVSAKDARALAPSLRCGTEFIEGQPKGSYAAHVQGISKSALPLRFPFGFMEGLPKMHAGQQQAMRSIMRGRYAVHVSKLAEIQTDGAPSAQESLGVEEQASLSPKDQTKKPGHIDTDASDQW